jgi:hypothetical protein
VSAARGRARAESFMSCCFSAIIRGDIGDSLETDGCKGGSENGGTYSIFVSIMLDLNTEIGRKHATL